MTDEARMADDGCTNEPCPAPADVRWIEPQRARNPRFDWDSSQALRDEGITLAVVDWPYCGIGSYFCAALDVPEYYPEGFERGKAYEPHVIGKGVEHPLVMVLAATYQNRELFAIGSRWTLKSGGNDAEA